MAKLILTFTLLVLGFEVPAFASEFQEQAMCAAISSTAAFPKISIQVDPTNKKRAILILSANDGWTQVYSGPIAQSAKTLAFKEDTKVITATFDKDALKAKMSFNNDEYICDARSFGH